MNIERNKARFEALMASVKRPGAENLMNYIRRSDFYQAPASSNFHLSCPGGLLQHSLNVYDALYGWLAWVDTQEGGKAGLYIVCGRPVARILPESAIIMALLHDLCKTHYYTTELRNKKIDGKWVQVPVYTIDDKVPYGHGEKSVMMIEQFMRLTPEERYAIRWHMGFTDGADIRTVGQAIEKYPAIWALHDADIKASKFMEAKEGNRPPFDQESPNAMMEHLGDTATEPEPEPEPRQMSMEDLAAAAAAEGFQEAEKL